MCKYTYLELLFRGLINFNFLFLIFNFPKTTISTST